jgi:hypothetical protein
MNMFKDVEKRLEKSKRALFLVWSHHCLTRNGGLLAAAEAGEIPREALFNVGPRESLRS